MTDTTRTTEEFADFNSRDQSDLFCDPMLLTIEYRLKCITRTVLSITLRLAFDLGCKAVSITSFIFGGFGH